jgi:hypothetical protein
VELEVEVDIDVAFLGNLMRTGVRDEGNPSLGIGHVPVGLATRGRSRVCSL